MASIKFERVNKIYPSGVRALSDVSFEIKDGEFCVFVGPSGCGKSTLLRMIAGLEEVTTGKIYIDGVVSNEVLPKDREIAMVFQNYALYPHLTVFQNMAFGLQMQAIMDKDNPKYDKKGNQIKTKYTREEIKERVEEAAKMLGIEELLSRKPGQLSGGQKQRVALGRALVRRPKIFLLDEPLSNVDAQIRNQMRSEIKQLQYKLKATFVYVTHDQTEAMTMADKIVVLNKGVVQQIGTPSDIYFNPQNLFAATFIGTPAMNTFEGKIYQEGKDILVKPDGFGAFKLPDYKRFEIADPHIFGEDVVCGIRPDDCTVSKTKEGELYGDCYATEFLGTDFLYYLKVNDKEFVASSRLNTERNVKDDEKLNIQINKDGLHIFKKDNEKNVMGLADITYLSNAKIKEDGELSFNGETVKTDLLLRLIDKSLIDFDNITFGIKSEYITSEEIEDALKVDVTVTHVSELKTKSVIYCKTKDNQNISFNGSQSKQYKEKDKLSLYLPIKELHLYSTPFGNRLTGKWELFDNVLNFTNRKNIVLDKSIDTKTEYVLPIKQEDILVKRKRGYSKALVLDDDYLGDKTVIYAKFNNDNYISIVVDGLFDRHDSPYIYLKIK